jgi:hypothetical protein
LNSVLIERIRGVHLADLDVKSWFIGGANTPCYRKHEAQDKHVEADAQMMSPWSANPTFPNRCLALFLRSLLPYKTFAAPKSAIKIQDWIGIVEHGAVNGALMRSLLARGSQDNAIPVRAFDVKLEIRFQGAKHRFGFAYGEAAANTHVAEFRIRNFDRDCCVPTQFSYDIVERITGEQ